jgi:hypothetical protein
MKPFTLLLFFLFFCLSFPACNNPKQQTDEKQIINMLNNFYISYISEQSKMQQDFKKIDVLLKKYCTDNLQKQIQDEEIDYDLLIDGQYCKKEWLNTMVISKYTYGANIYIVNFNYTVNKVKKKKEIKLQVIKNGNNFLIDKVLTG